MTSDPTTDRHREAREYGALSEALQDAFPSMDGPIHELRSEHVWESLHRRGFTLAALPDSGERAGLDEWARNFVRAAAAQLHDVNGHLRWEGNKPTTEPFDWTTNCQHGDCINARRFLVTPTRDAQPAPQRDARPGGIDYPGWLDPLTGKDKTR